MELRKHQIECVEKIREHFETENKGLIKMFCGAGKSFVIYHCLLEFGNNLSVIVVPSISLITKFNKDYLLNDDMQMYNKKYFDKKYKLMTICSKNELSENKTEFVFSTEDNDILQFLEYNDNFLLKKLIFIYYDDYIIIYIKIK